MLITRGVVFCTPDGLTAEQITSLVMRWLGDHPEKRHLPGPQVAPAPSRTLSRARRADSPGLLQPSVHGVILAAAKRARLRGRVYSYSTRPTIRLTSTGPRLLRAHSDPLPASFGMRKYASDGFLARVYRVSLIPEKLRDQG